MGNQTRLERKHRIWFSWQYEQEERWVNECPGRGCIGSAAESFAANSRRDAFGSVHVSVGLSAGAREGEAPRVSRSFIGMPAGNLRVTAPRPGTISAGNGGRMRSAALDGPGVARHALHAARQHNSRHAAAQPARHVFERRQLLLHAAGRLWEIVVPVLASTAPLPAARDRDRGEYEPQNQSDFRVALPLADEMPC